MNKVVQSGQVADDIRRIIASINQSEVILAFPACGTEVTDGGGAGGGGGTVTSVGGGVGITNTPEPIVGIGTVDLDVNSLTTETVLAGGDLLPFVDVSVGVTPASQRKISVTNLLAGLKTIGGLLDGAGTAGEVAYWADPNTLTSDGNFVWDATNHFLTLGLGDSVGSAGLTVFGANQAQGTLALTVSAGAVLGPRLQFRASRGIPTAPTNLLSGDLMMTFQARGYDGTSYASVGQIRVLSTEAYVSTANHGSFMDFSTTPNAAVSAVVCLKLDQNADILSQVSKAGATRLLSMTNTSNTAAAQARVDIGVAGTTAGDPFQTFSITGGSSWALGADNSDSDAFKLSRGLVLGTTDVFSVSAADGDVTFTGNVDIRSVIYTWPAANAAGVLTNDAAGNLSWTAVTGTGTVTSVAGGVGITNSPEPITASGTVDLDVNSLTTETVLATGDLLPFVDVSVGVTPASQRKITVGNLLAGLQTLGSLVDGGGTAGQVAFWSDADTLTSENGSFPENNFVWDPTTNFLGLGVAVPTQGIDLQGLAQNSATIAATLTPTTTTLGARLQLRAGRGTLTTPTALTIGDSIGVIQFRGYGTSYQYAAGIQAFTTEGFSGTALGTRLEFLTTANTTASPTTRLVIDQNGNVGIGPSATPGAPLDVVGKIRTTTQLESTVTTGTAPLVVASTTLVTNLNADLLDGLNSTAFQPIDADLTALAALAATGGLLARTGAGAFAVRTLTAGSAKITVANGDGVAGNPTVDLGPHTHQDAAGGGQLDHGLAMTAASLLDNDHPQYQLTDADLTEIAAVANVQGDLLVTNAGPTWVRLAIGVANRVLRSNGTDPSWAQVALATDVTGTLPIGSGGTGQVTAGAAFDALSPLTLAGGLITHDGVNNVALPIGTVRTILRSNGLTASWSSSVIDNNARVAVNKNSGATVGTRRRINLIEGANITLTIADDAINEEVDVTIASAGGGATHNLLSATHPDTLAAAVVQGDLIVGNATPAWARVAIGASGTVLHSNGTTASWQALVAADLPTLTSAEWLAHTTDPSGTGQLVFNSSPTLVTPIIVSFGNAQHSHQNAAGGGQLDHGASMTPASLADDDHSDYARLTGRSLGQILRGGTASSESLEFLPHNQAQASGNTGRLRLNERVVLWPSAPASITTASDIVSFAPTVTLAPVGVVPFRILDLSPTATISPAAGGNGVGIRCLRGGGTYTSTALNGFDSFQFFLAAATLSSATAAIPPIGPLWFFNQGTVQATANDVGTVGTYGAFDDNGMTQAITSASAKITVDAYTSFTSRPRLNAAIVGNVATLTTRTGISILDVIRSGAGTRVVTNNIGIFVAALTSTNTPISLQSVGAAVEMRHAGPVRVGSGVAGPTGGSILHVDGGLTVRRTTVADVDYTALTGDLVIEYTSLTANRTVNLPAAATAAAGKVYVIKKGVSAAFNVIVDPSGAETIDGAATLTITAAFGVAQVYCTGAAWMSM